MLPLLVSAIPITTVALGGEEPIVIIKSGCVDLQLQVLAMTDDDRSAQSGDEL